MTLELRRAIEAELRRQHDDSGIHDLVVSGCDEEGHLNVFGKVDVAALALAVYAHREETAQLLRARSLLLDVKGDYCDVRFTDRHGMCERLTKFFKTTVDPDEAAHADGGKRNG